MRICISVGHSVLKNGYITSADGTQFGGGNEYKYCKEFARVLKKHLVAAGHKVTVLQVPEHTVINQAAEKAYKMARYNKGYDLNIELHLNAASNATAEGTEVLYKSERGKKFATAICNNLSRLLLNRGPKQRNNLYFLNSTRAVAVLLELFFCTNKSEWKKGKKKSTQEKMAKLITEAIDSVK